MSETNELAVIAQESGLEESKVNGLLSRFSDNFKSATIALEWSKTIEVTNESQKDLMEKARTGRLKLKAIRLEVEHTRKELKEQSLREGKAIDGMANIIKAMIVPAEEHLEKQEKFAENLATERKARLSAERLATLLKVTDVPTMYSYETMEQDVFDKLVADLTATRETERKAIEKVELERKAAVETDAKEQERIRAENAQLKKEAEAREAAIAAERRMADEKAAKEKAEYDAKLAKECEAREIAEKAEVDRKAEEDRKTADAEASARKALLAPDKEKLLAFADILDTLEMPALSNRDAGKVLDEAKDTLTTLSKTLRDKAQKL